MNDSTKANSAVRTGIKWGLIFGAAVTLWTLCVHLLGFYTTRIQYASLVDSLALIIPIIVFTAALLERSRDLNGSLWLREGVTTGLIVAVVAAPITVGALWIYHHYINPEWLTILIEHEREVLAAAGAAPAEIAARIERLQQGGTDQAQILAGLIGTIILGLLLSLAITLTHGLFRWLRKR